MDTIKDDQKRACPRLRCVHPHVAGQCFDHYFVHVMPYRHKCYDVDDAEDVSIAATGFGVPAVTWKHYSGDYELPRRLHLLIQRDCAST